MSDNSCESDMPINALRVTLNYVCSPFKGSNQGESLKVVLERRSSSPFKGSNQGESLKVVLEKKQQSLQGI